MASAKESLPLRLPRLTGGINTFGADAGPDQPVDALNVWEREGDLQRRPKFKPIATGPVMLLPAGSVYVIKQTNLITPAYTNYANRNPTIGVTEIGGATGRLWVGCDEPFDGIELRTVTGVPTSPTANRKIWVRYRQTNGTLVTAHDVVDTTSRRGSLTDSSLRYFQPLWQNGRISWHTDDFLLWTATTVNSITKYWVALDLSATTPLYGDTEPTAVDMTGTGNITVGAPGIRAFVLRPVTALVATKLRGAAPVTIASTDSIERVGNEPGGNLGYIRNLQSETETALLVAREGSGVLSQNTTPAWSGGVGATGTEGAVGFTLTKNDRTYSWNVNEFDAAPHDYLISTSAVLGRGVSAGSTTTRVNVAFGDYARLKGMRLKVVAKGAGGTPLNEEREIINATSTYVDVYDAFSVAPDTDNRMVVNWPPFFARTREGRRLYEIESNTANVLTFVSASRPYQTVIDTPNDSGRYINFEIGKEASWCLQPGETWSSIYEPVTGKVLLTNGRNGILEFDGNRLRRLQAIWDPTDGVPGAATVRVITGDIESIARELGLPEINDGAKLRHTPPNGKFLADYYGHIVVANLQDRSDAVQWSSPTLANNIWPTVYDTRVRDADNGPITGMWNLGGQLIIGKSNSLHAATRPNDQGVFAFQPLSQGIGFVSHNSVAKVVFDGASALIGPAPDGLYITTGQSPQALVDSWSRVIPGGVNTRLLSKAVGTAWLQENLYFLALPSSGSNTNNRVLVYDYAAKKSYVWSAPFGGITSMAREFSESGRERILFGHADGHVTTLGAGNAEGVESITGRAKSAPVVFQGLTMAFTAVQLAIQELGSNSLTLRTYVNEAGKETQEQAFQVNAGGDTFGDGLFDTATWGDRSVKMKKVPIRGGGVDADGDLVPGHVGQSFQYEIEGSLPFRFKGAYLETTAKGDRFI